MHTCALKHQNVKHEIKNANDIITGCNVKLTANNKCKRNKLIQIGQCIGFHSLFVCLFYVFFFHLLWMQKKNYTTCIVLTMMIVFNGCDICYKERDTNWKRHLSMKISRLYVVSHQKKRIEKHSPSIKILW